jgi:hypothetical protein
LQRFLSTALVLGLLVFTAAAFAITEGLKLTPSPITKTKLLLKAFSPLCNCPRDQAVLKFSLRKGDVLTLDVVTPQRVEVKRLVDGVFAHAKLNSFVWDGRTDSGAIAADGAYQFRVHLAHAHRTILLPNRLQLDTLAPTILSAVPNRASFSPDGDGRSDSVKIEYKLSGPARAELYFRGRRIVLTRFRNSQDSLTWPGRVNGVPVPQGTYHLRLGAVDAAGNSTPPARRKVVVVHVRYIDLARHVIVVKAGTRFGVRVETDAVSYDWRLGPMRGRSSVRLLVVRAPSRPGTYRLVVSENGHRTTATVHVRPRS